MPFCYGCATSFQAARQLLCFGIADGRLPRQIVQFHINLNPSLVRRQGKIFGLMPKVGTSSRKRTAMARGKAAAPPFRHSRAPFSSFPRKRESKALRTPYAFAKRNVPIKAVRSETGGLTYARIQTIITLRVKQRCIRAEDRHFRWRRETRRETHLSTAQSEAAKQARVPPTYENL